MQAAVTSGPGCRVDLRLHVLCLPGQPFPLREADSVSAPAAPTLMHAPVTICSPGRLALSPTSSGGPVRLGRDFKGPVPPLPPQCRGRCPARSRGSRPFVNDACWPFAPCERPASHAHRSALPPPRGSGVQCGPGACPSPPPASSPACPSIRRTGIRTCVRVCTCA